MAGTLVQALQMAGFSALVGILIGLVAWRFEPEHVNVWGASVPRVAVAFLFPGAGLLISLLLSLFAKCDPLIVSHSPNSRASIAAAIVLPTFTGLILHIIVLWAGLTNHVLSTTPIVFVSGLLLIAIGGILYTVEQNHIVGIRDVWTLRSPQVWEKTHRWAYRFYILAGIALLVLAFVVPTGLWAFATIVVVFLVPTIASVGYSYIIREDQYSYIVR